MPFNGFARCIVIVSNHTSLHLKAIQIYKDRVTIETSRNTNERKYSYIAKAYLRGTNNVRAHIINYSNIRIFCNLTLIFLLIFLLEP